MIEGSSQKESEPQYVVIEGVRFDARIDDEFKKEIIEDLKRTNEFVKNPKDGYYSNTRNYLEHRMVGSSADKTLNPLMPYAVISGSMTPEQVKKKREEGISRTFEKSFDLSELDKVLDLSPEQKKELSIAIESVASDSQRAIVVLNYATVADDGRCAMPTVKLIKTEVGEVFFQPSVGEVKLREYEVWRTGAVRGVIDEKGWRYDCIQIKSYGQKT